MPGVLTNAIDWVSRFRLQPFNKPHRLLLSASPSMVGGNRGLWALRVPFWSTEERECSLYLEWLTKQPLADNTRRTYRIRVTQYYAFLATHPTHYRGSLREPEHARDYAVRDYKAHLQTTRHAKPSSG